jgi:adenosylhomocysteine nucleosidase
VPARWDVVVVFALGLESGGLMDRMRNVVTTRCATFVEREGELEDRRLLVCETGVGCAAAARATEDIIAVHHPRWIISTGFAASLEMSVRRGHIIMPAELVDTGNERLGVGFRLEEAVAAAHPALHTGRLLTIDKLVRDREEKEQLGREFSAQACDMETMAVAQVCRRHDVRFLSVRVISDQLDDQLPPEIERMLGQRTIAAKLGAATGALWRRPGSVKDMWRLRETATRAADRLAAFLVGVLPQLN